MSEDTWNERPRDDSSRGRAILAVGFGGVVGAQARYGVGVWVDGHWGMDFPLGTLLVNASGSVLLGVLLTVIAERERRGQGFLLRLFVVTGILGGYTTFSTFSYEAIQLVRDGRVVPAVVYVVARLVMGIVGVMAGIALARAR